MSLIPPLRRPRVVSPKNRQRNTKPRRNAHGSTFQGQVALHVERRVLVLLSGVRGLAYRLHGAKRYEMDQVWVRPSDGGNVLAVSTRCGPETRSQQQAFSERSNVSLDSRLACHVVHKASPRPHCMAQVGNTLWRQICSPHSPKYAKTGPTLVPDRPTASSQELQNTMGESLRSRSYTYSTSRRKASIASTGSCNASPAAPSAHLRFHSTWQPLTCTATADGWLLGVDHTRTPHRMVLRNRDQPRKKRHA